MCHHWTHQCDVDAMCFLIQKDDHFVPTYAYCSLFGTMPCPWTFRVNLRLNLGEILVKIMSLALSVARCVLRLFAMVIRGETLVKLGVSLIKVRRRTLPQLYRNLPKVWPRIAIENTLKTHRVTESVRDIILTKISPRFNQRLTWNVQGRGIVPKSEQ